MRLFYAQGAALARVNVTRSDHDPQPTHIEDASRSAVALSPCGSAGGTRRYGLRFPVRKEPRPSRRRLCLIIQKRNPL